MIRPEHLQVHDGETTYDRLMRMQKTAIFHSAKAHEARVNLFARLEDRGLGMVEDDYVFHYFPRFLYPTELKGIAV